MDSLKKSLSYRQNSANNARFKCEICETSFSTKHSLKIYVKIVHGEEKIFPCNVCSKTFGFKSNLNKHMKTIHEDKKVSNVILASNPSLTL